ncbi:MAG TPA: adenylyltransferase/cytidyltransferase family protein [Anaerolineales bacterium]|nr:adenylyltransferase/cytidyltransferase family protein [Anaerolineales bacterium]
MTEVCVGGAFNDLRSRDVRFLQEAARLGDVTVFLWSDEAFRRSWGRLPEFPQAERLYMLESLRFVRRVILVDVPDELPRQTGLHPDIWAVTAAEASPSGRQRCAAAGIDYQVIPASRLDGFPLPSLSLPVPGRKKVIVTGCYDWLHSGHIRFFEQAASYGDLYVSIGSDSTIRQLKGAGHPLQTQAERLYMVQAVRPVYQAFIGSGSGYLDVAPDIERVKPDIYLVNQDGDRPEKREFCRAHGLQYVVLQRLPKDGLPARQSTLLRGF